MKSILKALNKLGLIVFIILILSGAWLVVSGSGADNTDTGGAFLPNATTGQTTDTINNNTTADTSYTVTNPLRYKYVYFTYRQNSRSTYAKVLWDEPTELRCRFSPAANGDTGYVIEKPGPTGIGWTRVPVLLPSTPTGAGGVPGSQPQPVDKIWLTVGATAGIISWYGRND